MEVEGSNPLEKDLQDIDQEANITEPSSVFDKTKISKYGGGHYKGIYTGSQIEY